MLANPNSEGTAMKRPHDHLGDTPDARRWHLPLLAATGSCCCGNVSAGNAEIAWAQWIDAWYVHSVGTIMPLVPTKCLGPATVGTSSSCASAAAGRGSARSFPRIARRSSISPHRSLATAMPSLRHCSRASHAPKYARVGSLPPDHASDRAALLNAQPLSHRDTRDVAGNR